ncbi:MAG TPA: RdgB/HAM1 family non-canonical purine NTP pyrophosphatase [Chthoniobacterales bacterium]|nr:RdgB/HAM1 family non-canonical purine NTP pyrophosphatase [Chthoniobacterales bacterium]
MIRLLVATRNPHKTREYRELLGAGFQIDDLLQLPELGSVDETGASFEENAKLKALCVSAKFPGLVMADDSGLEVDALGGAPGIRSARYAGELATDKENIAKLLGNLWGLPKVRPRSARFRCALALARQGRIVGTFEGVVEGTIVSKPRGGCGFGYDPIFLPEGFDRTFAELPATEKNRISHRARAIEALRAALRAEPDV